MDWTLGLLAVAVAFGLWAFFTRQRALSAQKTLYQALDENYNDLRRQYAATLALYKGARTEADELRSVLGERDLAVADLKDKIQRDWVGTMEVAVFKHRGKGGTLPIAREVRQIEGQYASYRIQTEHPSGDIYDFSAEVRLGVSNGDS